MRQFPTFQRAAKLTHDANRARLSEQASAAWLATLTRYAFPFIGDRRVDRIEQGDVLRVLTPIWTTKPPTARKVRAAVRATLAWSQAHGYTDHNVAGEAIDGALPAMAKVTAHHRALDYRDMSAALERIAGSTASEPVKACLRFVALTAVRSSEARLATWDEVDLDARTWTVPAARMKTGVEHRVPLSGPAVAILEACTGASRPGRPDRERPRVSFRVETRPTRELQPDPGAGSPSGWTRPCTDSARRSGPWASEQTSFPHAVCEMALAHRVGGDVVLSYARGDLFEKRRSLMTAWASYVTEEAGRFDRAHDSRCPPSSAAAGSVRGC